MSKNLHFDFAPDVRPVSDSPTLAPSAERTRRLGQVTAGLSKGTLWGLMLEVYACQGPKTDAEMAICLRAERSTINARRNELVALGKVKDTGETRKNPSSGVENTLWGLVK